MTIYGRSMYPKYIKHELTICGFCLCLFKKEAVFTNALCSHFAVSIWALASEWSICIDAILTGLAVMFIAFTLIHICDNIKTIDYAGYVSHIWV